MILGRLVEDKERSLAMLRKTDKDRLSSEHQ